MATAKSNHNFPGRRHYAGVLGVNLYLHIVADDIKCGRIVIANPKRFLIQCGPPPREIS
jgi:hypothetical protein